MKSICKEIKLGHKLKEIYVKELSKIERFELSHRTKTNLIKLENIYKIEWYDYLKILFKGQSSPSYLIYGEIPGFNIVNNNIIHPNLVSYFRKTPPSGIGCTILNFLNGKAIPVSLALGKRLAVSQININSAYCWIGLNSHLNIKSLNITKSAIFSYDAQIIF